MNKQSAAILILVDDDAAVLNALKFVFEVDGFEVRAYPNAESLLRERKFPQAGCLILDYRLPGRNGLELLHLLRGLGVCMPAVLITTGTPEARVKAEAARVPLVEKPLLTTALMETVRGLLNPDASTSP